SRVPTATRLWSAIAVVLGLATVVGVVAIPTGGTRAQQSVSEFRATIRKEGGVKLDIGVAEFAVLAGPAAMGKTLTDIALRDLAFSGDFTVVPPTVAPGGLVVPPGSDEALRKALAEFAAANAQAVLLGFYTSRDARAELEIRVYDLASPDPRV